MNTKYIHLTTLITLFVSYFSTAQTTSFSNNVILKNDTVITLHLGGLNDGYNSQKVHEYIAGGFPDYKRISTIEPLDSIIISNNDTNNILKLQIITDENNIYSIDSIAKTSVGKMSTTENDSLYNIYRWMSDKNYYFYIPEIESKEFKEVTRHIGIYGYGHCGSIANCVTQIGQSIKNTPQRLWYISNGAHGISEIKLNSKWVFMDADEEMIIKDRNNKDYCSFGEAFEDLYLLYRTKAFGSALKYSIYSTAAIYTVPRFFNNINHQHTDAYYPSLNPCYKNDTTGNKGPELKFDLLSGESLNITSHKVNGFAMHHLLNNTCYGPYGYLPDSTNVLPSICNAASTFDIFATAQSQSNKFFHSTNLYYSHLNQIIKKNNNNQNASFILNRKYSFPITNSTLLINYYLSSQNDSINIFASTDNINWTSIKKLSYLKTSDTISFSNFIAPTNSIAKYTIYIKVELKSLQSVNNAIITDFIWKTNYQFSRYLLPKLHLGNNNIKIKIDSNLSNQVHCKMYWKEYNTNTPPQAPSFPIFPANNSVVNKTNIPFRWEQLNMDNEGDSIGEWQFQLSEYSDFRTILANNFDYYSHGNENNKAYFYNYFDTINSRNTFFIDNQNYYWRIRVRDIRNCWSTWSNTWTFKVLAPLSAKNLRFELNPNDSSTYLFKWDKTYNDLLTSNYLVLNNSNPTSLYFHPTEVNNIYTTINTLIIPKNNITKAFRVYCLDQLNNCSNPSAIATIPDNKTIQIHDTINLTSAIELLQHPFPNYPSMERDYFLKYDTLFFNGTGNSLFAKKYGETIVSICYVKNDDTIYKKQIKYKITDFYYITTNCIDNSKFIKFNIPLDFPYTLKYKINNILYTKPIINSNDSLNLVFGSSILLLNAYKLADTVEINRSFDNNNYPTSISISNQTYNCDSNKTMLITNATGFKPFNLTYISNQQINTLPISNNIDSIFLSQGDYNLLYVEDSIGCVAQINQIINCNYKPISVSSTSPVYYCDSNKTRILYTIQGNKPFTFNYTKNSNTVNFLTDSNSVANFYENGIYHFQTVTDSTGCIDTLNENYTFNYNAINAIFSTPLFNCDSNKALLQINLQGNAPWVINYTFDGNPLLLNTNIDSVNLFLANGTYQFLSITDATGCSNAINQVYNINFQTISTSITTPFYNCDSNKTEVGFAFQGNSPFTLNYLENATPKQLVTNNPTTKLWLNNGNYNFTALTDATGCTANLNQTHTFNYDTIDIQLSTPIYNCDSNKTKIHFELQGNAPWSIQYTQNGNPLQINTSSSSFDTFFGNGVYQFLSVSDATLCVKNINQVFNFNYLPISVSASAPVYNCDSNKTQINFSFQGNPPFSLVYTKDATPLSINSNNASHSGFFSNGGYLFGTLTDATGCTTNLNQTHTFNFDTIDIQLSTPIYNCDSNKTKIHFELQGNAPWTIQYTQNGTPLQINTSSNSFDTFFGNGVYQFLSVSDATLCVKNINQVFNFNYLPISVSASAPVYNCDSNKTQINFSLQGNPPFSLAYTKDATPLSINSNNTSHSGFFSNGAYVFGTITDATGCTANLNQTHTFNYDTIDIQLSTPIYNCDSNKTKIHFELQGNAPWTIQYTQNGTPLQINTSNNSFDLFFGNGLYQFLSISDATMCLKNINQVYNFNYLPVFVSASLPQYRCDSNKTQIVFSMQGNPPFSLAYTQDSSPMTISSNSNFSSNFFVNGNYNFTTLTDATGCMASLNQTHNFNFDTLDIVLSTPIYDCDSNKTKIHFELQGNAPWTIQYTQNGTPLQLITSTSSFDLHLTNGVYQFVLISDATQCVKNINQAFNFSYLPIFANASTPTYRCDSNKTQIDFNFQGNPPFSLAYTQDANPLSIVTSNTLSSQLYSNGNYNFTALSDATGCMVNLNQSYNFNFDTIDVALSTPVYNCDSNKTRIEFNLQGNAPWTIYYLYNGLNSQYVTTQANSIGYFNNGNYLFTSVADATNCAKQINQSYSFNYLPISASISQQIYDCDSNKYKVSINYSTGNYPWTVVYHQIGGSSFSKTFNTNYENIWLENGDWIIDYITDATGCIKNLNTPLTVNFDQIQAYVTTSNYDCDSNKTIVQFSLLGNAPWTIYYTNTITNTNHTFVTSNNIANLWLGNGNYLFSAVTDITGCTKSIYHVAANFYTPLSFQIINEQYHCDSNKIKIDYHVTGDPSWTLTYKNLTTNTTYQQVTSNINNSLYLPTGTWELVSITDTKCVVMLHDTLQVNFPQLTTTLATPVINCDSAKMKTQLLIGSGLSPFTLHYNYNGQNLQYTTSQYSQDLILPNGNYYFAKLTDSVGCEVLFAQAFAVDYTPIHYISTEHTYGCSKDSTSVQFTFNGQNPIHLVYNLNNQSTDSIRVTSSTDNWFANGNYSWLYLVDSLGCVDSINENLGIQNVPVRFNLDSIRPNCIDKKHELSMSFEGRAPWKLTYNKSNIPDSISFDQQNALWSIDPGSYFLLTLEDSNHCQIMLNQTEALPAFIDFEPVLQTDYKQVYIQQNNLSHMWYQNNSIIDSIHKSTISINGAGEYFVILTDSTGCQYKSNTINITFDEQVILYPNPAGNEVNVLVDDTFDSYWQFIVTDAYGQKAIKGLSTEKLKTIDIQYLESGIYSLTVIYNNENGVNKKVLRLLKR